MRARCVGERGAQLGQPARVVVPARRPGRGHLAPGAAPAGAVPRVDPRRARVEPDQRRSRPWPCAGRSRSRPGSGAGGDERAGAVPSLQPALGEQLVVGLLGHGRGPPRGRRPAPGVLRQPVAAGERAGAARASRICPDSWTAERHGRGCGRAGRARVSGTADVSCRDGVELARDSGPLWHEDLVDGRSAHALVRPRTTVNRGQRSTSSRTAHGCCALLADGAGGCHVGVVRGRRTRRAADGLRRRPRRPRRGRHPLPARLGGAPAGCVGRRRTTVCVTVTQLDGARRGRSALQPLDELPLGRRHRRGRGGSTTPTEQRPCAGR